MRRDRSGIWDARFTVGEFELRACRAVRKDLLGGAYKPCTKLIVYSLKVPPKTAYTSPHRSHPTYLWCVAHMTTSPNPTQTSRGEEILQPPTVDACAWDPSTKAPRIDIQWV